MATKERHPGMFVRTRETHARERRLLRALFSENADPVWADFDGRWKVFFMGKYISVALDPAGCPIISDELNAALCEALGEKVKP